MMSGEKRKKNKYIMAIITISIILLAGFLKLNVHNNGIGQLLKNDQSLENLDEESKIEIIDFSSEEISGSRATSVRNRAPVYEAWNKTYGSSLWDYGYSVQQTTDSGFIISGLKNFAGSDQGDAWLIKTDKDGNELWNKTYGGVFREEGYGVKQTTDGGYIVVGMTRSYGAGKGDLWIIKTDSNGNETWNKTFGGLQPDNGLSIQLTKDGGYIIVGRNYSYSVSASDIWLVKIDKNGNKQWDRIFAGSGDDYVTKSSVRQTSDNGYIIFGHTESYGNGAFDYWLIKTNDTGIEEWNRTYGGLFNDVGYSGVQTPDKGFLFVGHSRTSGNNRNIWIIKTNSTGVEEWNRTTNNTNNDGAYHIQQTGDGGYIIMGSMLIKLDKFYNEEWNLSIRGDQGHETFDKGYIMVASTDLYGAGNYDAWLIKINHSNPNRSPNASAGPDQNVYVNQTVSFDGSKSYDPDNDTLSYYWDFGDGTSTNWQYNCNSSHVYNKSGVYKVTLFVSDGVGGWGNVNDTCNVIVSKGPPLANSQWPKFRGNIKNTGLSPYDTSQNQGELQWTFFPGNSISSSPAVDSFGTIYVGSNDYRIYAINPDGTLKWKFQTKYHVKSSPAIGSDGTIYVGSNDYKLYAINPSGTENWNFTTGDWVESSPTLGPDGTIYVGSRDDKLYAINSDGTKKWSFNTNNDVRSSPGIASDGTIYVGSDDSKLYAINTNGTQKWSFNANSAIRSSPAISSDGIIYFGDIGGTFYAINPTGTQKWIYKTGAWVESSAAIGSDGIIYVGSNDKKLHAIYPNGTQKWNFTTYNVVRSSPSIGYDGTIYVGSNDKNFYAINPNGTKKWSYTSPVSIDRPSPAIGSDGTIYVCLSGTLYALGVNNTQPPNQPPIANAGPDKNITLNQTVYFDGSGSYDPDGDNLTYKWDFGDGTSTGWQNNSKTLHSYDKAGVYTVTLSVSDLDHHPPLFTDNDTCIVRVSKIQNYTPLIEPSFKSIIELDEDFGEFSQQLTNFETHGDLNISGDNLKWYVTGDTKTIFNINGENSTGENADTIIFESIINQYGTEYLTYHLHDPFGFEAIIDQMVIVNPVNDPPIADAGTDQNITNIQLISLNANKSYDIDGEIKTYEWTSNINGKLGIGRVLNNIKLSEGVHTITLKVSDGELIDIDSIVVRVTNISGKWNQPPVAKIKPIIIAIKGKSVHLSAADSFDKDGYITQYIWNFGDSSEEITTNISYLEHTWNSTGNYTITLTVIDDQNATNSISFEIKVIPSITPDSDGKNKQSKDYTLAYILIAIVIMILLLISTSKFILTRAKRNRDKEPESDEEILNNMKLEFLEDKSILEMEYSRNEIEEILENKFKAGLVSEDTYHLIKTEVLFSEEAMDQMTKIELKGKE
jgi:outer membrane protein assembly factor BamB